MLDHGYRRTYNTGMEFELTPELTDQIIFAIENQEREYVFDSKTSSLLPLDDIPPEVALEEDRFLALPEWFSVHGYNLMEKFVANLKNPLYREALRDILASGKGVFRHFKDTIRQRKDIERLWFAFKDREMRRVVLEWYNQLRESWGLARVGAEPEETEELILSDFVIRDETGERIEIIRELDSKAFAECFAGEDPVLIEYQYRKHRNGISPEADKASIILVAETPVGEFAGFIWCSIEEPVTGCIIASVRQLYVIREYRGLGLSKVLFHRLLQAASGRNAMRVFVDIFGSGVVLSNFLKKTGFEPVSRTLEFDLENWRVDQVL